MSFGAPLGLLALLAVPAVVAAYFLRRRQPPRRVSALFLWRTPDQRAEAGPRFDRFSREASLALELLAIACAALFLADARCGETRRSTHLVVVVDGSLSMQASHEGRSIADRVKAEVAALAREEQAGALTLIESGPKARVLAGPRVELARGLAQLEAWVPVQPSHDVTAALTLARELSSTPGQRVVFFTDGPVPDVPPEVSGRSLGVRQGNRGFVSVQRRDERGVATVTARVGNFSDDVLEVPVVFTTKDQPEQRHVVKLGAGATGLVRVSVPTGGPVDVSLPADALALDNRVSLLASPEPTLNVTVLDDVGTAAGPLTKALAAIDGVSLGPAGTYVFGGPASSADVRLGATGPLTSFVGPFFTRRAHPLLDDVPTSGVVWTAGANPPGQPLVSAGGAVLVSEGDDGVVHLNLELSRSNVQRSVAWPVLVGNLVRRARQSREGFTRRLAYLGEDVALVTTAGATWALEGPTGERRPVLSTGPTTVPPLGQPGAWALLKNGERVDRLEVLALDAEESDLRTRGAWSVAPSKTPALASFASERRPGWPWLLAMLALVVLDFWVTARRRV